MGAELQYRCPSKTGISGLVMGSISHGCFSRAAGTSHFGKLYPSCSRTHHGTQESANQQPLPRSGVLEAVAWGFLYDVALVQKRVPYRYTRLPDDWHLPFSHPCFRDEGHQPQGKHLKHFVFLGGFSPINKVG